MPDEQPPCATRLVLLAKLLPVFVGKFDEALNLRHTHTLRPNLKVGTTQRFVGEIVANIRDYLRFGLPGLFVEIADVDRPDVSLL